MTGRHSPAQPGRAILAAPGPAPHRLKGPIRIPVICCGNRLFTGRIRKSLTTITAYWNVAKSLAQRCTSELFFNSDVSVHSLQTEVLRIVRNKKDGPLKVHGS